MTDTNQKLREALQAISDIDDSTNHAADASEALDRIGQIARQALALPTADHIPDAGKMIETAAPVGEHELPPLPVTSYQLYYQWSDDEDGCGGSEVVDGDAYTADQMRAYARAALSAVLAEREACAKLCEEVADDLITAMREEGETDDEAMTSFVASARVCVEVHRQRDPW